VNIENDQGGTDDLPAGTYKVRIVEEWNDYETGNRAIGVLTEKKDIETSRKAGKTGFAPKSDYHPEKVYFSPDECILPDSLNRRTLCRR
jgi:hypothetical protein